MELNKYIFSVQEGEEHLLMNLLNGITVLLKHADYVNLVNECYQNISPNIIAILQEHGFLVVSNKELLQPKYKNIAININITNNCNFNCEYCYFKANNKNKNVVSVDEVAFLKWMDDFVIPTQKDIFVNYLGGEPLLEYKKIISISQSVMEKANKYHVDYGAEITTNGYYLTPDKARELKRAGISSVQITLDGNRNEHDSIRFCRGGVGTYDKILNNICDCMEIIPIVVRINLNRKSSIENIKSLLTDLNSHNIRNIYFSIIEDNYISEKGDAENNSYAVSHSNAVELYNEAWLLQKEMGIPFLQKIPTIIGNCIALNPYGYSINYDGKMYVCPSTCGMQEYQVDDLYGFMNNKKKNYREKKEKCEDCRLYPLCMGGCDITNMIGGKGLCPYEFISQLLTSYFKIKFFSVYK